MNPSPIIAHTRAELQAALAGTCARRAVVMTMGALHQGHFDLIAKGATLAGATGTLVVTIFVNPLQFAPGEDLEAYPRDLAADVAGISEALHLGSPAATPVGKLVIFAPTAEVMYPHAPLVRIDPGPLAAVLEGASRPTHFAGVLQVVLMLLHLTAPRWAVFGRKDAQQLALVTAMVRDLALPVQIVPVAIRREADGLALSSRNAYLSSLQRQQALALSQALRAGRQAADAGADAAQVRLAAWNYLAHAEGVATDYVAVVDPETFVDLSGSGLGLPGRAQVARSGAALLALAARVGSTRLIDNTCVQLG